MKANNDDIIGRLPILLTRVPHKSLIIVEIAYDAVMTLLSASDVIGHASVKAAVIVVAKFLFN